jgi:hypothetical protein
MERNEIPHDPRNLGVLSGVSKMIIRPMVRSAQAVHLSCSNSKARSKQTEMTFHMTQVT